MGRTGHNYANKLSDNILEWYSKNTHSLSTPSIQRLINTNYKQRFFFTRTNSNNPEFLYQGHGKFLEADNQKPVRIMWDFSYDLLALEGVESIPEEVSSNSYRYREGARKQIYINAFERDANARKKCIEHYGCICCICGFNFSEMYGIIGDGFIVVHHLTPLSEIEEEYEVNPVEDLRPVCPNCHAMLHRTKPPLSVDDLRSMIR